MRKVKDGAHIPVFQIDGAVTAAEMEFTKVNGEKGIKVPDHMITEYQWLTFLPLSKDADGLWPVASRDGKDWRICFGAEVKGEKILLSALRDNIEKSIFEMWEDDDD